MQSLNLQIMQHHNVHSLSILDRAVMIAQEAPDFLLIELFIEHCFFHIIIIAIRNFLNHLPINFSMKKVDTPTAVGLNSTL